jgi:glycosyltransferase involved in cell wall biosynthesis
LTKAPRVLFAFNRPRGERQALFLAGKCPDDALYGFNAVRALGYDAFFSDDGHNPGGAAHIYSKITDILSAKGKRVGFHLKQARALATRLADVDLIFATADSSALPLLMYKALGRIRCPIVYATIGLSDGFYDRRGAVFSFYKRLVRHADRIIHFGYSEGRDLVEMFGADPARVRFVPFGVDCGFYDRPAKRSERPAAVGMDPRRDWKILADALRDTGVHMDVYTYPDLLKGIGLPDEFHAHGLVTMDEMAERIAQAAFVVLPVKENRYTGATITLLSAMAAGKAAIVSKTAAIESGYGLEDGVHCVLVPPGNADALRAAVRSLSGDPEKRRAIGLRAKEHVARHFTVGRMAEDLSRIFREVLP